MRSQLVCIARDRTAPAPMPVIVWAQAPLKFSYCQYRCADEPALQYRQQLRMQGPLLLVECVGKPDSSDLHSMSEGGESSFGEPNPPPPSTKIARLSGKRETSGAYQWWWRTRWPRIGSPQNPAVRIATLRIFSAPRDPPPCLDHWATSSRCASLSRTELPRFPMPTMMAFSHRPVATPEPGNPLSTTWGRDELWIVTAPKLPWSHRTRRCSSHDSLARGHEPWCGPLFILFWWFAPSSSGIGVFWRGGSRCEVSSIGPRWPAHDPGSCLSTRTSNGIWRHAAVLCEPYRVTSVAWPANNNFSVEHLPSSLVGTTISGASLVVVAASSNSIATAPPMACLVSALWPCGGVMVRLHASHVRKLGSIPTGVAPGFLHEGIILDDATGRWVFSGISHFSSSFIVALLHAHLTSSSLAFKTSMCSKLLQGTLREGGLHIISHNYMPSLSKMPVLKVMEPGSSLRGDFGESSGDVYGSAPTVKTLRMVVMSRTELYCWRSEESPCPPFSSTSVAVMCWSIVIQKHHSMACGDIYTIKSLLSYISAL
ncbi:hypothetical protein PR048_018391 [Dryococelus australis]|uniref:Uncharacterized protein n=1 Tax=Dryococelus australis TaxID=614101 RepID=A0ABQ9HCD4_9NEOP|nr:hypothetical protein PR048_018391 [Dryococelus australis]